MDMKRKIIKVGTSGAVILPKELLKSAGLKIGDTAIVRIGKPSKRKTNPQVRPEVIEWVNRFIDEDRDLLNLLKDA